MVPVPGPAVGWKARDDHVGLVAANEPNNVGQHLIAAPVFYGLFGRFREAEIIGAAKKLVGAVYAPGRQQFLRTNHAHGLALL